MDYESTQTRPAPTPQKERRARAVRARPRPDDRSAHGWANAGRAQAKPARRRPIGAALFSIATFLGSVAVLLLALFAGPLGILDGQVGPVVAIQAGAAAIGLFGLVTAIGMWSGTRWGWYLTTFGIVFGIVNDLVILASTSVMAAEAPSMALDGFFLGRLLRHAIYALILLYFFRSKVEVFYDVRGTARGKRFLGLVVASFLCVFGLGLLLFGAMSLAS